MASSGQASLRFVSVPCDCSSASHRSRFSRRNREDVPILGATSPIRPAPQPLSPRPVATPPEPGPELATTASTREITSGIYTSAPTTSTTIFQTQFSLPAPRQGDRAQSYYAVRRLANLSWSHAAASSHRDIASSHRDDASICRDDTCIRRDNVGILRDSQFEVTRGALTVSRDVLTVCIIGLTAVFRLGDNNVGGEKAQGYLTAPPAGDAAGPPPTLRSAPQSAVRVGRSRCVLGTARGRSSAGYAGVLPALSSRSTRLPRTVHRRITADSLPVATRSHHLLVMRGSPVFRSRGFTHALALGPRWRTPALAITRRRLLPSASRNSVGLQER